MINPVEQPLGIENVRPYDTVSINISIAPREIFSSFGQKHPGRIIKI